MAWQDKIAEITDALIKLDERLGMKKIIQYFLISLLIVGAFNFKSVLTWTIKTVAELNEQIHAEKMEKRDQLNIILVSELHKMLGATGADRILYFEYHNSKENLIGIPFKYIDLVIQCAEYGVPYAPENNLHDLSSGNFVQLYRDLQKENVIACLTADSTLLQDPRDLVEEFNLLYPGNHEFFVNNDDSKQQMFVNVCGMRRPIGMVVLEWMSEDAHVDKVKVATEATNRINHISGYIESYAR